MFINRGLKSCCAYGVNLGKIKYFCFAEQMFGLMSMLMYTGINACKMKLHKVIRLTATAVFLAALSPGLSACYSAMPIANARTAAESKSDLRTYIVYYDTAVGNAHIEDFIKENKIEVVYRYTNINGYALRLRSDEQRAALEKVSGVLSVQADGMLQLH